MLSMGLERLEPCVGKLASTVLMGVPRSNTGCLTGREPFFTKHRIALDEITSNIDDLSYDFDLLSNYYREQIEDEDNEDRIKEIIEERLFEA